MDNGPEFISIALAEWAEENGVQLEFIKTGRATQNSYVERFNRTYRNEVLDYYVFRSLMEVRDITESWLPQYKDERPHESLGKLTPSEYRHRMKNRIRFLSYCATVKPSNFAIKTSLIVPTLKRCLLSGVFGFGLKKIGM